MTQTANAMPPGVAPKEEIVTQQQRNELHDQIKALVDIKGNTQAAIARRLDVSPATISQIVNGKMDEVTDAMVRRLRARLSLGKWKIIKTQNFLTVQRLCHRAGEHGCMLAIAAQTGFGKTEALRYFAAATAGATYVRAKQYHNKRSFLMDIVRAMDITPRHTTVGGLLREIETRMSGRHYPVLLLDDVHKLPESVIHLIYDLYESFGSECGIVLAGTEHLKTRFDRRAARDAEGWRELHRRVTYWEPLDKPEDEAVLAICQRAKITDRGAIKYILSRADNFGALRNLVTNATVASAAHGVPIDRELLVGLDLGDENWG